MTEAPGPGPADMPLDPDDFGRSMAGVAIQEVDEQDNEVPTDLDERAQQDFIGLMYLGYVEDECEVAGHRFRLRTPNHDERIERGNLHRPYIGSLNFEPLWELATVATYCIAIDGVEAPEPLNPKKVGPVETRLQWIKDHIISSLVIRKIFEQTLLIDARERVIVEYLDEQSKS